MPARSTGSRWSWTRPASSREASRTSSSSVASWIDWPCTIAAMSRFGSSGASRSTRISEKPSTAVAGVRSSCEAIEMNSLWSRFSSSSAAARSAALRAERSCRTATYWWPERTGVARTTTPIGSSEPSGRRATVSTTASRAARRAGSSPTSERSGRPNSAGPDRPKKRLPAGLQETTRSSASQTTIPSSTASTTDRSRWSAPASRASRASSSAAMRSKASARSPISSWRFTPVRLARSPFAIASAAARSRPSGRTTQSDTRPPTPAATSSASAIRRIASRSHRVERCVGIDQRLLDEDAPAGRRDRREGAEHRLTAAARVLERAALAEVELLERRIVAAARLQDASRVRVGEHDPAVEVDQAHAPVHTRLDFEHLFGEEAQRDLGPHHAAQLAPAVAHRDQVGDDRLTGQARPGRGQQLRLPGREQPLARLEAGRLGRPVEPPVGLPGRPQPVAGVVHVDRVDPAPLRPDPVLELGRRGRPVAPLDQAEQRRPPGQLAHLVLDRVQEGRAGRGRQIGGHELAAQDVLAQARARPFMTATPITMPERPAASAIRRTSRPPSPVHHRQSLSASGRASSDRGRSGPPRRANARTNRLARSPIRPIDSQPA